MRTWARAGGCAGSNYTFLTQKERDNETGLDYFGARYYGSTQGRFTSPDPLLASGRLALPQSWNRYAYVLNNPLRFSDPSGMSEEDDPQKPRPPSTGGVVIPAPCIGGESCQGTIVVGTAATSYDSGAPIQTNETPLATSVDPIPTGPPTPTPGGASSGEGLHSLLHLLPRKFGEVVGAQGALVNGAQGFAGTASGFWMHDFVDNSTLLGESHGGFAFERPGTGGWMASLGVVQGTFFPMRAIMRRTASPRPRCLLLG